MPLFRRNLDARLATAQIAQTSDYSAVSRLFRDSSHRFVAIGRNDLPSLLADAQAMTLAASSTLWAVALAGRPHSDITWLRGLAFTDGLSAADGLAALLPPFHQMLRDRGLHHLYYAGDTSADRWLQPLLRAHGYVRDTEVIVYEKYDLLAPSFGNQLVWVRPAQIIDLAAVLELDQRCFAAQWVKDDGVLGPAIGESPFFMVAELDRRVVAYAFATSHFGGRMIHLVRIAVDPALRGQAIGVRMLAELVRFAQSQRTQVLALNTQIENSVAQRLYEWFGFRRTGEQQMVLRFDLGASN